MFSLIKKLIPSFIKSLFWQTYLRFKFHSKNKFGKGICFSKDLMMGKNCRIGSNVIIGRAVKLGNNVSIGKDVFFENIEIGDYTSVEGRVICTGYGNGKIKIGRNSYIGIYNVLDWSDNITIGDFVHIAGPSTGLWTHTSAPMCLNSIPLDEKSKKYRPTAPIVIESNVYIGGNCTIYPGIKIGHHSIVAPNSAVTKDVPPYTMVGGVPAKIIKNLPKSDTKC
jgi:acetyltransferase-like isoleucine patch superfamily enzyme